MKQILPNIHLLTLGSVNAYLIEQDRGDLTLIDTGYSNNKDKIFDYVYKIGKHPGAIKNIVLTHAHSDHTGSAAAVIKDTKAVIYMHTMDAALVEKGMCLRENMKIAPGLMNKIIYHLVIKKAPISIEPVQVTHRVNDHDLIPIGEGFRVIQMPGHCQGQIALLYPAHGGVLFAADTCANAMGLGLSPFNEDNAQCHTDLQKLADLHFAVATFGHGAPILEHASQKFQKKFLK